MKVLTYVRLVVDKEETLLPSDISLHPSPTTSVDRSGIDVKAIVNTFARVFLTAS